jgi:hypothetical protein
LRDVTQSRGWRRPTGKFNAASLAVEFVSKVFLLMVAPMVAGEGYARSVDVTQLRALAGFALSTRNISFDIALILFGCACLVGGYLIFKSGYLPKLVGLLLQLAGLSYLIASFSELFAPEFERLITPWILLPPLIGESSLCLWLLLRGVNVAKWRERLSQGARA